MEIVICQNCVQWNALKKVSDDAFLQGQRDLNEMNENLKKQIKERNEHISCLNDEKKNLVKENENLKNRLYAEQVQRDNLIEENEKLKKEIEVLWIRDAGWKRQMIGVSDDLSRNEKRLEEDLNETKEALKNEKESFNALLLINEKLQSRIKEFERGISCEAELMATNKELSREIERNRRESSSQMSTIIELRLLKERTEEDLENLRTASSRQIADLNARIKKLKEEKELQWCEYEKVCHMDEIVAANKSLVEEIKKLRADKSSLANELRDTISTLRNEKYELKERIKEFASNNT